MNLLSFWIIFDPSSLFLYRLSIVTKSLSPSPKDYEIIYGRPFIGLASEKDYFFAFTMATPKGINRQWILSN
jgi:hypothetical protein